jgi:L-ascorbate metabolism protein UlaG (beta-lactamase superfamily)
MKINLDGIKITWLGHATFRIETPGGKILLIDPWVMGNPKCPDDQKTFEKIDVMLCTHGHGDHIGDAVALARKHNPVVVGIYELCLWMQKKGAKQIAPMNKGGSQTVGDVRVTMVHANHSAGIEDEGEVIYGADPCGYVIQFENNFRIYHAGDTNVFGDMSIIHDLYAPDLALIPIGDLYTMGPREASYACRLLRPKAVIPMHFGTFPQLTGTPAEFTKLVSEMGLEVIHTEPGKTLA